MKHNSSSRRSRNGRNGSRRSNNIRTKVFDSNGPDVRIRGNAMQVHEKYVALARDASSAGDHILAESYLQHAEHYQRLINEMAPAKPKPAIQAGDVENSQVDEIVKNIPIQEAKEEDKSTKARKVKEPEMA